MITAAPMPAWKDLLALGASPLADDATLAGPWAAGSAGAAWYSRGAFAIEAIVRGWARAHGNAAPRFWLPDYFCNQSMAPARAAGAQLVFYPVGDDLRPRWDALDRMAAEASPDLLMLVHYFGEPQDATPALQFCRRHGALLIEDAAHALAPSGCIGAAGDFVLYSPSKVLPVPDGAVLLVREAGVLASLKQDARGNCAPPALPWIAKRAVQKVFPGAPLRILAGRRSQRFDEDAPARSLPPERALSPTARRRLARLGPELSEFAGARRANARALRVAWSSAPDGRPLSGDSKAAPYRFVLRFKSEDAAARAYDRLRRRGCPAESWPDLPPEVLADPGRHASAIRLRRTLLFLPVHHTLPTDAIIASCGP